MTVGKAMRRQSEEQAVGSSQAGQLRQAAQFMAAAVGKRRAEAEQMLRLQQQRLVRQSPLQTLDSVGQTCSPCKMCKLW